MKPAAVKAPDLPVEQAADLAVLQAEAIGADPQPGAPDPVQAISLEQEFSGLTTALLAVVGPLFPSLKPIYTPEVIEAASSAVAAVCRKRGWLAGGVMGEYAEEVTALIVCGPLALASVQAVRGDLASMKAKAGAQASSAVSLAPTSASAPPDNVIILERG